MSTKAIHEMTLSEAQEKLKQYVEALIIAERKTRVLNDMIESLNTNTPDLRDCIRILKDRIRALEIES